jgi:hypothetical protein
MVPYIEFLNVQFALSGPIPDMIVALWQEVSAGHRATGLYTSNLSFTHMFPYKGKPLSCAVANTTPYAAVLEEGRAGFHLPSSIDWGSSRSAKVSKKGTHYLRIPLRHMTPGRESEGISSLRARTAMPSSIHRAALAAIKSGSRTTGGVFAQGRISRPYRAMRDVPNWLTQTAIQKEGHPGYTWRAGKYEGIKRVTQRGAGGAITGSQFMTWRTLSEDSVGWWIPPMQGFHFAAQVVQRMQGPVSELLGHAVAKDIADIISLKYAGEVHA